MSPNEIARLKELVTCIHDAIKSTDMSDVQCNLARFPNECCHWGCELLRIFLHDKGFERFEVLEGRSPKGKSEIHVWLEIDGVTVDITAYQFDGVTEEVIVSRESEFHAGLDGKRGKSWQRRQDESESEYCQRGKQAFNEVGHGLYDRIIGNLPKECS